LQESVIRLLSSGTVVESLTLGEVQPNVEIWAVPVDFARVAVGHIEDAGQEAGEYEQLVDLADKAVDLVDTVIDLVDTVIDLVDTVIDLVGNQLVVAFAADPVEDEQRAEIEDLADTVADFGQEDGQQKDHLAFEEAVAVHHFPFGWAARMLKVAQQDLAGVESQRDFVEIFGMDQFASQRKEHRSEV
jgi:hypothetical protein